MQLFIQKQIKKDSSLVTFDKIESRHLAKVLRKKEGDIIHVTNGLGSLFTCKLEVINNNQCIARILETQLEKPRTYSLHITIAHTKTNDNKSWFFIKVTEFRDDYINNILCHISL